MSGTKVVVPDGMLEAAMDATAAHFNGERKNVRIAVEAALRWLSDNPIVPTDEQLQAMREHLLPDMPKGAENFTSDDLRRGAIAWHRRINARQANCRGRRGR